MKQIYNFFFIMFICTGFAQSNVVATGGNAVAMDNASLSYSIGQIDYISLNSASGTLTLGNQQPYEIFVLEFDFESFESFSSSEFEVVHISDQNYLKNFPHFSLSFPLL